MKDTNPYETADNLVSSCRAGAEEMALRLATETKGVGILGIGGMIGWVLVLFRDLFAELFLSCLVRS